MRGEVEYEVPPLAEPEAVELFCMRSQLASSEEIGELCARLDNLPLAVELAAARTKALSPAQILERLSGPTRPAQGRPRRRSPPADAARDDRVELRPPLEDEQRLFARLSVFARGCTFAAAEEVADADLDTVQSLVEKGLLRFTDERYWMLETIREFAAERLSESGDEGQLRRRHARFFLELAQSLGMTYESIEVHGRQRHDVAIAEQENFRSAIDWAFEHDVELAARIAVALEGFWVALSPFEAVRRFGALLERAEGLPYGLRAGCWRCLAGSTVFTSGRIEDGINRNEKSLDLYRRAGDERGIAIILNRLGVQVWALGDAERGRSLIEESLARHRALRFGVGEAVALGGLGRVEYGEGNVERGLELVVQSAELCRVAGFTFYEAQFLDLLASYAFELGRLDEALRHSCAALMLSRRTGERRLKVLSLARIAGIAAKHKDSTACGAPVGCDRSRRSPWSARRVGATARRARGARAGGVRCRVRAEDASRAVD